MSLFASGVVGWTDLLLYNLIQAVHDCWSPITVQFRIKHTLPPILST